MDVTLLLLIIALIVVIVLFVVTLRAGASNTRRAAVTNNGRQTVDRPAIAAPHQHAQERGTGTTGAGGQETQRLLADTAEGDASHAQAQTFAPPRAGDVTTIVGQQAGAAATPPSPRPVEGTTTATATTTSTEEPREPGATENAAPVAAAPLSSDGAPADDGSVGTVTALELAGPPATRTGAVMLSVTPQRLPYRLAELLGEQRGLEEAITIAHRRIDDIELGPDPGGADNRVRLAVLRQDLSQKQERLREILFLQDGYRWLQQHLAPERTPSES